MKATEKTLRLSAALTLAAYAAVQSFAMTAPAFPADDAQEFAFVRGLGAWWQAFGPDAFGLFRPVKNLLFLLFAGLSDLDFVLCRLVAVALGIASFFPVRAFFRRVTGSGVTALAAAAVWLLSPTLVSSVAWLSCLNIQVMCAFAAAAVVLHDRRRTVPAAACLLAACASYECAVATGPVLVAFDLFLRPERLRTRRAWGDYAFYAAVTLVFLAVRHLAGSASSVNGSFAGTGRPDVIAASAYFTCLHFFTWLWPFGRMAVFGGYVRGDVPVATLALCWAAVAAAVAGALYLRGRRPVVAFALALALVGFLPVSNVTGVGNGPYGDYYLGLASMGLSLAYVAAVRAALSLRARAPLAALAVATALVVGRVATVPEAARWAGLWADADRAYAETERTFPRSFHTAVCRAQRACDAGDWRTALACCARAEAIVGADSDKCAAPLTVRAIVALNGTKDAATALAALDRALALPGVVASVARQCRFYRGCVYEDLCGDTARAEAEYAAAIPERWTVDTVQPADRLARLLAVRGEFAAAAALWERALRLQPGNGTVTWNLALARRRLAEKATDR